MWIWTIQSSASSLYMIIRLSKQLQMNLIIDLVLINRSIVAPQDKTLSNTSLNSNRYCCLFSENSTYKRRTHTLDRDEAICLWDMGLHHTVSTSPFFFPLLPAIVTMSDDCIHFIEPALPFHRRCLVDSHVLRHLRPASSQKLLSPCQHHHIQTENRQNSKLKTAEGAELETSTFSGSRVFNSRNSSAA